MSLFVARKCRLFEFFVFSEGIRPADKTLSTAQKIIFFKVSCKKHAKKFAGKAKRRNFAAVIERASWLRQVFGVWCNWQHYRFWSCLSWFESGYPNQKRRWASAFIVALFLVPSRPFFAAARPHHKPSVRDAASPRGFVFW